MANYHSTEQTTSEEALIQLVQQLSHAITYTESANFDTNKKLWNNYAKVFITQDTYIPSLI
jgi:hypothetical protein